MFTTEPVGGGGKRKKKEKQKEKPDCIANTKQ